jgi:hypothetical protein
MPRSSASRISTGSLSSTSETNVLFLDVDQIGIGGTFTGALALPSAFQFDFPVPELPLKLKLSDARTDANRAVADRTATDTCSAGPG